MAFLLPSVLDCLKNMAGGGPELFETRAELYGRHRSSSYSGFEDLTCGDSDDGAGSDGAAPLDSSRRRRRRTVMTRCEPACGWSFDGGSSGAADDEVGDSDDDADRESAGSGSALAELWSLPQPLAGDDDVVKRNDPAPRAATRGNGSPAVTPDDDGFVTVDLGITSHAPPPSPVGVPVARLSLTANAPSDDVELWGGIGRDGSGSDSDSDDSDDCDGAVGAETVWLLYEGDIGLAAPGAPPSSPVPAGVPGALACKRRKLSVEIVAERWSISMADAAEIMANVDAANRSTPDWS